MIPSILTLVCLARTSLCRDPRRTPTGRPFGGMRRPRSEYRLYEANSAGVVRLWSQQFLFLLGVAFPQKASSKTQLAPVKPGPGVGAAGSCVLLSGQKELGKACGVHVAEQRRARRQQRWGQELRVKVVATGWR